MTIINSFTEIQPEIEKNEFFFRDLVHDTSVTGGWTGKVGNLHLIFYFSPLWVLKIRREKISQIKLCKCQ